MLRGKQRKNADDACQSDRFRLRFTMELSALLLQHLNGVHVDGMCTLAHACGWKIYHVGGTERWKRKGE